MANSENVWCWSTTAANNDDADSAITWVEQQDPGTVNNSARAMMAAQKRMANAQSGNVTVGGTANAITIGTGQSIDGTHQALGFRLCFKAAATNTGATTVAVDGLSAVAVQRINGDALSAGDIVSGGIYDIAFDGANYKLLGAGAGIGAFGSLAGNNTWSGHNSFNGNVTVGDDVNDIVGIKGTVVHPTMSGLLSNTTIPAFRSAVGLGAEDSPAFTGLSLTGNLTVISGHATPVIIRNTNATDANPHVAIWLQDGSAANVGSITVNGFTNQTVYNTASDGRLKDVIGPVDDAGVIIDRLEPVYFTWKRSGAQAFGFIAQDVAEVLPDAVTKGNDKQPGEEGFIPWMMQKGSMEAILVAEIKALRARVAALEAGGSS